MNKTSERLIPLIAVLLLALSSACDSGRRSAEAPTDPSPCVPDSIAGELIVTFVSTASESEARGVVEQHGLEVLQVSIGFSASLDHRQQEGRRPRGPSASALAVGAPGICSQPLAAQTTDPINVAT